MGPGLGVSTARLLSSSGGQGREPEVARCQHLQDLDAAGWNKPYTGPAFALGKHVGGWLGRYGWAQRAWLSQQHDLRFGTGPVRLESSVPRG